MKCIALPDSDRKKKEKKRKDFVKIGRACNCYGGMEGTREGRVLVICKLQGRWVIQLLVVEDIWSLTIHSLPPLACQVANFTYLLLLLWRKLHLLICSCTTLYKLYASKEVHFSNHTQLLLTDLDGLIFKFTEFENLFKLDAEEA